MKKIKIMKVFKSIKELDSNSYLDSIMISTQHGYSISGEDVEKYLGDLTNITPLLYGEIGMYIKEMPDYSDLYIQLAGIPYIHEEGPSLEYYFDSDQEISLDEPIKYSDWIDTEITKLLGYIESKSNEKVSYRAQECYQHIDSERILIGFDAWETNLETEEVKSFSLIGKAIPIYSPNYTDQRKSTEISFNYLDRVYNDDPIGSTFGDDNMDEKHFYRFDEGFYTVFNRVQDNRRRESRVDPMDIRLD